MQHFTEQEEWMQEKQKKQKRKRRSYTAAEFAEVWDRWGRGESSKKIARVMDRRASVYPLLLRYGGIRPPVRFRPPLARTLTERAGIPTYLAYGQSQRQVTRWCVQHPSPRGRRHHDRGGQRSVDYASCRRRSFQDASSLDPQRFAPAGQPSV